MFTKPIPHHVFEYTDSEEGFKGWLVRDSNNHKICAGGFRIQKGLAREHLEKMARNMTLKMRINELNVDGAKSGIDYDPDSPGRRGAIKRFLSAIRPYIQHEYSMGPDLNIDMDELEDIASEIGIPSVKIAIAEPQGWDQDYFLERSKLLYATIDGWSINRLRAGYGLATAALAVLEQMGKEPSEATFVIQGFGGLAKGTIFKIARTGGKIIAICDETRCIVSENRQGLDAAKLLAVKEPILPLKLNDFAVKNALESKAGFSLPCDIFIPAAVENTINEEIANNIQAQAIVPGANLAINPAAEKILFQKGITTLPDFLAGSGGSISMEALYAPLSHPKPEEILVHIEKKMKSLVKKVIQKSKREKITPTEAAMILCEKYSAPNKARPYGELN